MDSNTYLAPLFITLDAAYAGSRQKNKQKNAHTKKRVRFAFFRVGAQLRKEAQFVYPVRIAPTERFPAILWRYANSLGWNAGLTHFFRACFVKGLKSDLRHMQFPCMSPAGFASG